MKNFLSLVLFALLFFSIGSFDVCAEPEYQISVQEILTEKEKVSITGGIVPSPGKSGILLFEVFDENSKSILKDNIMTDDDGAFAFSFEVPESARAKEYTYRIQSKEAEAVITDILNDDFTAQKPYMVYSAARTQETGNPAPSAALQSGGRLLYNTSKSAAAENPVTTGKYSISADFSLPEKANKTLFQATNFSGSASEINTQVNKTGSYAAFSVSCTEEGSIVISCADNASEQLVKKTETLCGYEQGKWYSIKAVMNLDTLELQVYLNDDSILENLYILAQNNYNRLFDTWKDAAAAYVDNVLIQRYNQAEELNILPKEGGFSAGGSDYTAEIVSADILDGKLEVKAAVTPAVQYEFEAVVSDKDKTIYCEKILSDKDGFMSIICDIPAAEENREYSVSINPCVPDMEYKNILTEDFSGNYANGYLVYNEIEISDTIGNHAPSIHISKETGETRPRLLYSSKLLENVETGQLTVKADFMKPEKSTSSKIYGITDFSGNKGVCEVMSTQTALVLGCSGNPAQIQLSDNYETGRWYHLKLVFELGEKFAEVFLDDISRGSFHYNSDIPNLSRVLDSEAVGGAHYLDNISCVLGISKELNIAGVERKFTAYGTSSVTAALTAVDAADESAMEQILGENAQIFGISVDALNEVAGKNGVFKTMSHGEYNTVLQLRYEYYGAINLQKIKEAPANLRAEKLNGFAQSFGIDTEYVDFSNSMAESLLNEEIEDIQSLKALKTMAKEIEICGSLRNATKTSVAGVVCRYADILTQQYKLDSRYSGALDGNEQIKAASALLAGNYTAKKAADMITEIVAHINQSVDGIIKGKNSGGGSRGGGTGGGAAAGPVISEDVPEKAEDRPVFDDVPLDYWGAGAIQFLSVRNIISGRGNGNFEPEAFVTREEFLKLVVLASGMKEEKGETVFQDVTPQDWFAGYVNAAVLGKIANGESEKVFGAGKFITRQDAAVMIFRSIAAAGKEFAEINPAEDFSDSKDIAEYACEAIEFLQRRDIINGMGNGRFAPQESLTRAQAAMLVYKVCR